MNDIVSVAEALDQCSISIVPERCVRVRNRKASCRRCENACAVEAIEVYGNAISLDAHVCVDCGACVVACPTEALVDKRLPEDALNSKVESGIVKTDGMAVFACARIASKRQADPETYAEVPCLARVGEPALLNAIAKGATDVILVDGDCSTCKYRDCVKNLEDVMAEANTLAAAHGSSVNVRRVTGFPEELQVEDTTGLHGSTRRGFLSDAVRSAKETAMIAAKMTVEQELGITGDDPDIKELLRKTPEGTLPQSRVDKHDTAINALDAIGAPVVEEIDSHLFGTMSVDRVKCNTCGMCAMFCPTGALKRNPPEKPGDPLRYFEFSASDCVQCGLCQDVCWKNALKLERPVSTEQLYDFDPKIFLIIGYIV